MSEGVIKEKERFQRFVEHSPDAVAVVDSEMRYLCVSRRWETDFDSCGRDAIGRHHWELFPNLPEYWVENARACLAGVLQYSEFVEVRSAGSVAGQMGCDRGSAWVKWCFKPWKNSDNSIGGLTISIQEVTDQKPSINCYKNSQPELNSQQLGTPAELTQIALDRAADPVLCSTSDGRICYANQAACHLLGYSQSEILQLTVIDIDAQLSATEWPLHWQELKHQNYLTFECSYTTKSGVSLPVEVKVNYLEYAGCEYRWAIARDICDRQLAESTLLEAKDQLQAVLDAVPGLVSWVSSDLRYLGVNRHLAAAYQLPAEIFIGQKVGFLDTSPKFNDFVYEFFASSDTAQSKEVTASTRGENKTYLIVAQKYHKSTAAVFVGLDITERKQAMKALQESEQNLREQAAKLEEMLLVLQRTQTQLIQTEKMSYLGQLVAGVAHEINNPVSFIYGNISHADGYIQELLRLLELYQKYYPNAVGEIQAQTEELDLEFVKQDLIKLLNSMKLGSERIRDVVRSLRLFSRADEAEMKPADIHESLDSTLLILQNRLQAKGGRPGINLVKEYGDLPPVRCYPGQLNQVFMHLLTNAIDALEEGGKNPEKHGIISSQSPLFSEKSECQILNPEIRIRTEVVGDTEVAIVISDNGPGMTQEVLRCIFDPLFTTKPPGTSTGLGLSISHHLVVEKHGGKLEYFSEPGQGTEAIVKIAIGKS